MELSTATVHLADHLRADCFARLQGGTNPHVPQHDASALVLFGKVCYFLRVRLAHLVGEMDGMILIFETCLAAVDGAPVPRGRFIVEDLHERNLLQQDMLEDSEQSRRLLKCLPQILLDLLAEVVLVECVIIVHHDYLPHCVLICC